MARPINFDSIEYTSVSGLITPSATAWKFTAPESGLYQVTTSTRSTATSHLIVYKNGSASKTFGIQGSTGVQANSVFIKLNANDYIDVRPDISNTFKGDVS